MLFSGCAEVVGEDIAETMKKVIFVKQELETSVLQIDKAFRLGRTIKPQPQLFRQKAQRRQNFFTFSDVRQASNSK